MRDVVRPHPVGAQEKCPEKRAGEKQDEQEEEMEHLNPAQEKVGGDDGLSHHGDPEEEEVIVLEEPEEEVPNAKPRVLRAPRMPTQKEIDEHAATHIPHQSWCEICMQGRGRNSPHKKKKREPKKEHDGGSDESEAGDPSVRAVDELPIPGPVPRICMDYV